MQLFDAIVSANHRALAGDETAGVRPGEFTRALPVVVLTCCDPRLHPLMPEVLGVTEADFLWLTNAGNGVTDPGSSTARSVGLACLVHGGREVAVIGHTDCLLVAAARWPSLPLTSEPAAATLKHYLAGLTDERANVQRAVRHLRQSPFLPRDIPVHGLLVDLESGRLTWVDRGYSASPPDLPRQTPLPPPGSPEVPGFRIGGDLPPIGAAPP